MDGESNQTKKFSYPNADRTPNDSGEILGPNSSTSNTGADAEGYLQERHPTVHLSDALKTQPAAQVPNDMQHLRTYQGDVANAVHSDNISLIKIALAEKKRQQKQGTFDLALEGPSNTKKALIVAAVAITLLLIGSFVFFKLSASKNAPPVDPSANSTFSTPTFETENTVVIDMRGKDKIDIENIIQTEKTREMSLGSMEHIKFMRTDDLGVLHDLDTASWLQSLRVRAPDSLLRAFSPGFIFGLYSLTPHDSFVILKVDSYDNAYAGMLAWEPDMEIDIGGIIINNPLKRIGEDGSVITDQFNGKPFVDKVINNKDARVLLNDEGKVKMLYSFIDKNTLVITSSESALREVVFRLTTGRISR